ncbi:Homeobox-leucine zipper protein ATHB-7 [Heracleum sosnowskyi]|uniref:Homeobox-leucine zipper protein n=1 Tax=Heracleum sosnowskyi TaxID=360622 RepID=A0AAD8MF70_9APIA|nr:Homeobox-leucine zipper protein ATHB-7 [Heracleum sosnowskyi]
MADTECYNAFETLSRKKSNNKRRFSDDQIKSLETMFESDTKLEPRKKLQVAKELGLHPRQVAIWFQNKRAQSKSKQLEKDYSELQAKYDNLATQFDILKKEKQYLVLQLQRLHDIIGKSDEERQETYINITSCKSDVDDDSDRQKKPNLSLSGSEYGLGILSDDYNIMKAEYYKLDEQDTDCLDMPEVDTGDGSLTSTEDWENLEFSLIFDQPSSSDSQWWDFWE